MPAATVGHETARIGDGADMMAPGVITHANALAASLGVGPGQSCRDAAAAATGAARRPRAAGSARSGVPADRRGAAGLGARFRLAGRCPSTRTRSSSPARMAGCSAAGRRPRSNTMCAARSITTPGSARTRPACRACRRSTRAASPAATVSAASARIGDARSTYEDGIVSRVNARAAALGLREGISAREFVAGLRRALPISPVIASAAKQSRAAASVLDTGCRVGKRSSQ